MTSVVFCVIFVSMTKRPLLKSELRPKRETTMDRVYRETSTDAREVAESWNTTKQELYHFLVQLAKNGEIEFPKEE